MAPPQTHNALVLPSLSSPPEVQSLPIPKATSGSVVVQVLYAPIVQYMYQIYVDHTRGHPMPTPLTIGPSAIGRVYERGPDTTNLEEGQLVLADCFIRGRGDRGHAFLLGYHEGGTEGSRKLAAEDWRHGAFAEYARFPLENLYPLDEKRLTSPPAEGGLGYKIEDLCALPGMLVPYGGLADVNLQAGETVVIAPATGKFGGSGVVVAAGMGANVIAMGRNEKSLEKFRVVPGKVTPVKMTGDLEQDRRTLKALGPIDVFLELSPPEAEGSTHIQACITSLRHGGRVSIMGGLRNPVPLPLTLIMHNDILLKGKWMYEPADVKRLIRMVELGLVPVGEKAGFKVMGKFKLQDNLKAFETARAYGTYDTIVCFEP